MIMSEFWGFLRKNCFCLLIFFVMDKLRVCMEVGNFFGDLRVELGLKMKK